MRRPPSRTAWAVEGEMRGHSVLETLGYLSDCADYEDAQQDRRRASPAGVILADCEPRWLTTVRRWFGR